MNHYLLTRFNLRVDSWKTAKDNSEVLTDEWLEHRLSLFTTYCLPSVIKQSNKSFKWLIFLDTSTPEHIRGIMHSLTNKHAFCVLLYIDGNKALKQAAIDYLNNDKISKDNYVITTRLDNDDAIHRDFIEIIQTSAIEKDGAVIDLRTGYQVDISSGKHIARKRYNSFNPFISLVESASSFQTIFSNYHTAWKDQETVIVYDKTPAWIEIIHQKNKLNEANCHEPIISSIDLSEFGISLNLPKIGWLVTVFNNLTLRVKGMLNKLVIGSRRLNK